MPKFLTSIDLNQNQLIEARIENLATAPTSPAPVAGQVYFNTTSNRLFTYNGTSWVGADAADATIANGSVTNAKLANMSANTIKGRITQSTGAPEDLSAANVKTILALTKSDVGLSNVTNDAQVKKAASSQDGWIPKWSGTGGDTIVDGYGVEVSSLTGDSNSLARADVIKSYVDTQIAAADAMIFKGTLGTGGTVTALPTTYKVGWTYRVITAATYAGHACEIGDMIVALVDRSGSGNLDADWTVIQANLDGAVIGQPAGVTDGAVPVWVGTGGKNIGGGWVIQSTLASSTSHLASAKAIVDAIAAVVQAKRYSANLTANASQTVTHNLGTKDLTVSIREVGSPYAQVMADIEFATDNTVTVTFAAAPSADQYRITLVG
jgi:hypothetical protein